MATPTSNPIQIFFDQYPEFPYDTLKPTMEQFWQLCRLHGWTRYDDERDVALGGIRDAIAQQFNAFYGDSENDLNAWHKLYQILPVEEIPDTVQDCKNSIKDMHVNICDLVDYSLNPLAIPPTFDTADELANYSREEGKIYPRENAYAEGLLKYLLREIFGVYFGHRNKRGKSRGGRRGGGRGRGRGIEQSGGQSGGQGRGYDGEQDEGRGGGRRGGRGRGRGGGRGGGYDRGQGEGQGGGYDGGQDEGHDGGQGRGRGQGGGRGRGQRGRRGRGQRGGRGGAGQ